MKVRAIIGVPGAGKTRRVAQEVKDWVRKTRGYVHESNEDGDPIIMSYTRAAAGEIAERAEGVASARARTVHSFALRSKIESARTGGTGSDNDVEKQNRSRESRPTILGDGSRKNEAELIQKFNAKSGLHFRISGGKTAAGDPYAPMKKLSNGDELRQEYEKLRNLLVPRKQWPGQVRMWGDEWDAFKIEHGCMDFTDMLEEALQYSPYCWGKPAAIWVDEAQDMTPLMLSLVRKWAAHSSCEQLTIVGDPAQAIYEWAGAHPQIFESDKIHEVELLDHSYRNSRSVHAVASSWIKEIRNQKIWDYTPNETDGSAATSIARYRYPLRALDEIQPGKSTMFMASCSFMLNPLIDCLKQHGIPFANPWNSTGPNGSKWNPLKRGGKTLNTKADRVLALLGFDGNWKVRDLVLWASELTKDTLVHGAKASMKTAAAERGDENVTTQDLEDWFKTFDILEPAIQDNDVRQALIRWFKALPPEKQRAYRYHYDVALKHGAKGLSSPPRVFVGTIHSFKGAEADTVVIFPDLSTAGRREYESLKTRDAIIRLGYVALTRARDRVVICDHTPKRFHGYMPLRQHIKRIVPQEVPF